MKKARRLGYPVSEALRCAAEFLIAGGFNKRSTGIPRKKGRQKRSMFGRI